MALEMERSTKRVERLATFKQSFILLKKNENLISRFILASD